jgi:hypothetical protein
VQELGRNLSYNHYAVENKLKLSDIESGGGGRHRDVNLNLHDPNAPTDYPTNSPIGRPTGSPTNRRTNFPTEGKQQEIEFEVDIENPGFDNQNDAHDPFDEMDDPEFEDQHPEEPT